MSLALPLNLFSYIGWHNTHLPQRHKSSVPSRFPCSHLLSRSSHLRSGLRHRWLSVGNFGAQRMLLYQTRSGFADGAIGSLEAPQSAIRRGNTQSTTPARTTAAGGRPLVACSELFPAQPIAD